MMTNEAQFEVRSPTTGARNDPLNKGRAMRALDWYQFEEGRIRFSGGTRGFDQQGYETFEVELPSGRYFGELGQSYPDPKVDAFYLTVPAFGAREKDSVGGLTCADRIRQSELDLVMDLVPKLAAAVAPLGEDRMPVAMIGRYLGKTYFLPGWAKLADE